MPKIGSVEVPDELYERFFSFWARYAPRRNIPLDTLLDSAYTFISIYHLSNLPLLVTSKESREFRLLELEVWLQVAKTKDEMDKITEEIAAIKEQIITADDDVNNCYQAQEYARENPGKKLRWTEAGELLPVPNDN